MPVTLRMEGSENLRGQTTEMTTRALIAAGLIVQNDAKQRAPYRTGTLRRSIHIGGHSFQGGGTQLPGPQVSGDQVTVAIGTNLEYAAQVEFGGTITARNAPYLMFQVGQGTDRHWVRVRSVRQQGRPYLMPALNNNQSAILREYSEALREMIESIR